MSGLDEHWKQHTQYRSGPCHDAAAKHSVLVACDHCVHRQ